MSEFDELDLGSILGSIKPSVVTPKLADVVSEKNDKKARIISQLIIKDMVERYNGDGQEKVPRLILHKEEAIEVRYLNVEPLLTGVWPSISLMILQLSYGEQTSLIEALYPKTTQFAAKAFAAVFTPEAVKRGGGASIEVKSDPEIQGKLDSANAGIAMIIAKLDSRSGATPHPDEIHKKLNDMQDLVEAREQEVDFQQATKRAQEANKFYGR